MTSVQPPTSTSVAVRAAEVRTYWAQVPARINQSSIRLIERSNQSAGWFSTAAAGAALATVVGSVMASASGKLAASFLSGDPKSAGAAAALGVAAGAAPAVAGWVSALSKDGPARGVLEGAGVATAYFLGLLGGVVSGWTEGAVWLGGVTGSLAALAYASGVIKRW